MYARTLLYKQSGGISMKQQVNLEIMDFVEKQILPKYNAFGVMGSDMLPESSETL